MNSEIKKSWFRLKHAKMLLDHGEISLNDYTDYFDEFYADAEPLIENLEGDDNEK